MRHQIIAALLALALLPTLSAVGQDLRLSASTDSVFVGERFFLTVTADVDAGHQTIFPIVGNDFVSAGDIEIVRTVDVASSEDVSVTHTDSATFEVAAFGVDSVVIADIPVAIVSPYGDTTFASAPPIVVGIYSIVPEDAAGIHDLAPLATFPPLLWPWIVGALVLLALSAVAYYIWTRRRGQFLGALPDTEVRINPYDEAVKRLRQLAEREPVSDEEIRDYHIELSDTLRTYLEFTVNVPALERTSAELMAALRRLSSVSVDLLGDNTIGQIQRSLDVSDLAKFANYHPQPEESREVLDLTRASIESIEKARRRRLAEAQQEAVDV